MKSKCIFDPIHKYIELEPLLVNFIDTPEFQRLRNIKQLGACYYVYSGAVHNRYEHSLGVSHLSGMLITQLKNNQPELNITDRQITLIKVAGLIHDLGHACFSHFFDNLFLKDKFDSENINHEYRSGLLLEHMIKKYNIEIDENECSFVNRLINPGEKDNSYMYQIVANKQSGLDCDKFDYIVRDTYNIGLQHSLDYSRLINQARVKGGNICYPDKLIYDIYELFHIRYRLHKQIYTHPCVNQIECMILDVLNLANEEMNISKSIFDMETFIEMTDDIIDRIYYFPSCSDKINKAKHIIRRLKNRKLYKVVGQIRVEYRDHTINDLIKLDNRISKNDVTVMYNTLNYNMGEHNPVDNIKFYSSDETVFNIDKDSVSKLLPNEFQEMYLRVICKNMDKYNIIRDVFNKLYINK